MRVVNGLTITSTVCVKLANQRSGGTWFSRDNMRYWGTRVGNAVYGGRYFVTSDETFDRTRAYSIRELMDDGSIDTVAFQVYRDRKAAHRAAKIISEKQ